VVDATLTSLLQQCLHAADSGSLPLASAIEPTVLAQDANLVRRALGIDTWGIYAAGSSTARALRMIQLDPKSVTALMVASPIEVGHGATLAIHQQQFDAFAADCAASPKCAANGDMQQHAAALYAAAANSLTSTVNDPTGSPITFDSDQVKGAVSVWLGAQAVSSALPAALAKGPRAFMDSIVAASAAVPFVPSPIDLVWGCQDVSWQAPAASERPNHAWCDALGPVPQLAAAAPLTSDIPVLVLNQRYNPVSSAQTAKEIFAGFSHVTYVDVPGMADTGSVIGTCWNQVRVAFYDHPGTMPDTTCLSKPAATTFG
jgi:pimeloyl-ACP methyl ester carboxylesterase